MTRRVFLSEAAAVAAGVIGSGATRPPVQRRIRLSLNENPFGPSPRAIASIKEHLGGLCRYPRDQADALVSAIAARENISPEHIVLGELLDALGLYLAASGTTGGEFIYSEPGYTALVDAVAPAGGKVIAVPLDPRMQNDLTAIAAKVNAQTRAIYLVNPHNPSGTMNELAEFLDSVRAMSKQALVIVDEAYLEYTPDFERRSANVLTRSGERVIVFRTFSKIFGLANLAIGYAVAPVDIAASLRRAGIGAFFTLNGLALIAATESLADSAYVDSVRAKVAVERDAWHALLRKLERPHSVSQANFVFFDAGRPHHEIARAFADRGIEIARAFPPHENWVRVSIGLPEENAYARDVLVDIL